ncbi:assimilatory nitrite reductase (NAD(P)H) small subunit [Sinobacterium caligoides]|uniref:Assimilatory nitrite reductase (NAD(P)H) small subunit n=1 Tax=Sinobacterium caligoides TaxID=933926 RepID=A0A3N2DNK5_9GAMM|nr:nitrite reductase small subunit NirD [Sinobacterium caligoides]ROS01391.1 assimilatory nitrite reductase (NAD(P)H) small subunit [Sinobacterium caligoides]
MSWTTVCNIDDILPNAGAAVIVNDKQIAIFRVDDELYALDNHDPLCGANIIARGIVGSLNDVTVVASPLYKQHYCLESGKCLEEDVSLATYQVRTNGDSVELLAA